MVATGVMIFLSTIVSAAIIHPTWEKKYQELVSLIITIAFYIAGQYVAGSLPAHPPYPDEFWYGLATALGGFEALDRFMINFTSYRKLKAFPSRSLPPVAVPDPE